MRSRGAILLIALVALALIAAGTMFAVAIQQPVVRTARLALPDWPAGAGPVRALFISDIHVAGPDMPPSRLSDIVRRANSLKPDIVLFGGDFVSDKIVATRHYAGTPALAPLAELRAPLGAFAVLGNHDHWRSESEIVAGLRAAGVHVLKNSAASVGPLRIGGVDDDFTGRADVRSTAAQMRRVPGARLIISHSPDIFPDVPEDVSLVLAGHTHCGQIRLPWIGAISYMSDYGDLYACGLVTEGRRRIVISAGVGTSLLPFRLGAVPDMWLVELGPA